MAQLFGYLNLSLPSEMGIFSKQATLKGRQLTVGGWGEGLFLFLWYRGRGDYTIHYANATTIA